MELPPSIPPTQQPVIVLPQQGMSCFAKGCLITLVILFLGFGALLAGSWFIFGKVVKAFTSTEPARIEIAAPSDAEFAPAETKLNQLREAARNKQAVTVEFNASELNALLARHPDLTEMRGKAQVEIADSIVTLKLSVPLNKVPLPGFKRRWFNGTARFGFIYDDGRFLFEPKALEANGRSVPEDFLHDFGRPFSNSFTDGFDESKKDRDAEFWQQIKTIAVDGDKLIFITKGEPGVSL